MESPIAPAAPAPPVETTTTATQAAADTGNLSAYREARQTERSTGLSAPAAAPLAPETPAGAVPAAPVEEPRQLSKKQIEINERAQRAVEAATVQLREENARLRSQLAPPSPAPAPPTEKFPPYADYLTTHPETSLEDYMDARDDWRQSTRDRATAVQRVQQEQERAQHDQIGKARERVAAARQADPTFDTRLAPEVLALKTREAALAEQSVPLAENDFATEIAKSEFLPQILLHLSDDPSVLQRVRALDTRRDVLKFVAKLETRFEQADPAVPVPKTVTSAPPPPPTVGTRNALPANEKAAQINNNAFTGYRATRRVERQAGQG